jgi:hypothetical protein
MELVSKMPAAAAAVPTPPNRRTSRKSARAVTPAERQPDAERVPAEEHHGRCGQPIAERRLLEIAHPVETRHDPVAAGDHLARDFGVAEFVGLVQRPDSQRGQVRDREKRQQGSHHALLHDHLSPVRSLGSSSRSR